MRMRCVVTNDLGPRDHPDEVPLLVFDWHVADMSPVHQIDDEVDRLLGMEC